MKSPLRFGCFWLVQWLSLVLLCLSTHAATLTWNGGSDGLWDDASQWLPQQVPGANDTAVIGGADTLTVRIDGLQSLGSLVVSNSNATLRVAGSGNTGQSMLTVSNGVMNLGTIELSSEHSSYPAMLTVSSGILTNAVGGVIRIAEGAGGPRSIEGTLDNQGTLEVGRNLTLSGDVSNSGTIHLADGTTLAVQGTTTWTHRSNAITGGGTLSLPNSSTFVLAQDFAPGGFRIDAPNLTISGPGRLLGPVEGQFVIRDWKINTPVVVSGDLRLDGDVRFNNGLMVAAGKTLLLAASGNTGQSMLTVSNGVVNLGTIELSSEHSLYPAMLTVSSGILTNAVGGVIRVVEGTGGPRSIEGTLDNQGTLEVGRNLTLSGDVSNSGTIHLADGATLAVQGTTTWTHRSNAITGGGTLSLPNASTFVLAQDFAPGGFRIDAPNLTINGPGRLLGPVEGQFVIRDWKINTPVVVSGDLRLDGDVRFNNGLMVAAGKTLLLAASGNTGQSMLTVSNGVVNLGTIELSSEHSSYPAMLTVSSSILTNAVGGVIRVVEGTGGPRSIEGALDNQGTLEVRRNLTLSGDVSNSGTIHLADGATLAVQGTTTWTHRSNAITGGGTLSLPNASTFVLAQDFAPGGFRIDAPNLVINGPGRLLGPVEGEFLIRDWKINTPVVVSRDLRLDGDVRFNNGLTVEAGKTLLLAGSGNTGQSMLTVSNGVMNLGTIELSSEHSSYPAMLTVSSGILTNAVGGVIRVVEGTGGPRSIEGTLDNQGTLEVETGTLTHRGDMINADTGVLAGNGRVDFADGTLINEGSVAPGASPGMLTLLGNRPFPFSTGSRFRAEIGGFTAGTEHDQLVLGTSSALDGTIRAELINGFFPKKNDAFTVLTSAGRTGTFSAIDNPLPERIAWEVRYDSTSAHLVVLNTAPTLAAIPDQTINEAVEFSVTASATDQDLAAQTMTYSLESAPEGMAIQPATGRITWNPTEAQGPGEFVVTVRVTDNGTPALAHTTSFSVTVNELNAAPQLVLPGTSTLEEQTEIVILLSGTDVDLPANTLTYEMVSGPPGAIFNPTTREFRWTPSEAQGPGNFTASFRVTDNSPDAINEKQLSATAVMNITVNEVNLAPVLATLTGQTMSEDTTLTVAIIGVDQDQPAQTLTYSLTEAPAGMTIDPATGAIVWTPTETQGPAMHNVSVRVTDNGEPELGHTSSFTVTVNEVNRPPVLGAVPSATIHVGTTYAVMLSATDPDLPANLLNYILVNGPAGATLNSAGRLEWTPPLASLGALTEFTVRVADDGAVPQSDEETVRITVVGPLEILSTTIQGEEIAIRWRSAVGSTYRVLSSPVLPAAEWAVIPGNVTATGETASKTYGLQPGSASSFFRVELIP